MMKRAQAVLLRVLNFTGRFRFWFLVRIALALCLPVRPVRTVRTVLVRLVVEGTTVYSRPIRAIDWLTWYTFCTQRLVGKWLTQFEFQFEYRDLYWSLYGPWRMG